MTTTENTGLKRSVFFLNDGYCKMAKDYLYV